MTALLTLANQVLHTFWHDLIWAAQNHQGTCFHTNAEFEFNGLFRSTFHFAGNIEIKKTVKWHFIETIIREFRKRGYRANTLVSLSNGTEMGWWYRTEEPSRLRGFRDGPIKCNVCSFTYSSLNKPVVKDILGKNWGNLSMNCIRWY